MRRGFGLVEVMVALAIIAIVFSAATRLYVVSTRTGAYADSLTYAASLAHSRLQMLKSAAFDDPALGPGWHTDAGNPTRVAGRAYYLAWSVSARGKGKGVTVYAAWNERGEAENFASAESLFASGCGYTQSRGYIEALE
ncbi:MAG: type II secretion system protein [Syntrophaceae bacterium]